MRRLLPRNPASMPSAAISPALSRRRFLQGAAGLSSLVVLGAWPELVDAATQPALTAGQLTGAMAALPKTGYVHLPGGGHAAAADLRAAAAAFAVGDASAPDPATNPVAALGVLVALGAWSGHTGSLDLTVALPKAPVRPVRLGLPSLPTGASTDTLPGAVPPGLVVRPGGSLVLIGALSGKRLLVAVEDPARQVAGHHRLELAVLRAADLAPLLSVAHAKLDSTDTVVVLASGSKVALRPLQSTLATRLLHAAGSLFVDEVPIQPPAATTLVLTAEPVVPAPTAALATQITSVSQTPDNRVLGTSGGGSAIARARYRPWRPDWEWVTATDEVADFTVRELADGLGITFASFAVGAPLADPNLVHTWEKIANTLVVGDVLDMANKWWVFGPWTRDDWAAMLARWSDVSAAFVARKVPDGLNLVWSGSATYAGAEEQLSFARSEGVRYVQAGMLLWGSNGVLPAVYTGGFSDDELRKILEFMVKVRVIKYAGRVQEWIAVSEASSSLLWGSAEQRFWYDRLGTDIIDQVFFWAHEADPTARLAFCEDTILDLDTDAARATTERFMEFLRHFKSAGVPVDKAVLENNLWIYAPPSKASMIASLQSIIALGYGIGAAETTVSVSDQYPTWAARPRSVASVADPLRAQADIYRDLLEAYLEVGAEFGIWAPADPYSWFNTTGHPDTKALLLDDNFQPKPAYFAVRDVLKKKAGLA